jgi:hypothetical protein
VLAAARDVCGAPVYAGSVPVVKGQDGGAIGVRNVSAAGELCGALMGAGGVKIEGVLGLNGMALGRIITNI